MIGLTLPISCPCPHRPLNRGCGGHHFTDGGPEDLREVETPRDLTAMGHHHCSPYPNTIRKGSCDHPLCAGEETGAPPWELGHNLEVTPDLGVLLCAGGSDRVPQILPALLKGVPEYHHLTGEDTEAERNEGAVSSPPLCPRGTCWGPTGLSHLLIDHVPHLHGPVTGRYLPFPL